MKRLIPVLLLSALVLGACKVRVDVTLVLNEDESGEVSLVFALDEELRQWAEQSGNDQFSVDGIVPANWTATDYVDGEFEGVQASTTFESIDAFAAEVQELATAEIGEGATPDFLSQLSITRNGDVFDFSANLSGLEDGLGAALQGAGGDQAANSAFLAELIDIRVVITMPGEIVESNADATAGSTLTWNLSTADDGKVLMAQSTIAVDEPTNLALPILVGVAILVVIIAIARRRKDPEPEPVG